MNIFKPFLATICVFSIILLSFSSIASNDQNNTQRNDFSQAEFEQILAPIALYPDSLLTHILIASTYPLEIIQAQRWLKHHKNYTTNDIADGVENKDWDASVKALMAFPRVIKRLNDDLDWTQKLGDIFLADEQQVLASIQILRRKADQAGNLEQMDNMDVVREEKTIIIKSIQPDVVYVPYYDSRYVYGDWYWYNYPPVYWSLAHNSPYYRSYNSPFYWHSGVTISFNYFFNAFHWQDRRVVVVDNYAPHRRTSYSYGYKINRHNTSVWQHNPNHRRGVAYHDNVVTQRYKTHYSSKRVSVSHSQNVKLARSEGSQYSGYQHSGYKSIKAKLHSPNNVVVRNKTKIYTTRNVNHNKVANNVSRTHSVIKNYAPQMNTNRVVKIKPHAVKMVKKTQNNNYTQVKSINSSQVKHRQVTRITRKSSHYSAPKHSNNNRGYGSNKDGRHQQRR